MLLCICWHQADIQHCMANGLERPLVGVVLSGGGAKGVAHIGALKVLERAGVPVDIIVGTSMGAIVGGLYAIGYSPEQLDSIVRVQDWEWLLSDNPKRDYQTLTQQEDKKHYFISVPLTGQISLQEPDALVKGQNLSDLFTMLTINFHDSIKFNRLPIPFACIATNLADGSEVVLDSGVLPEAMRASMAIPSVFSPVYDKGKTLVDGGLSNNFPVDVARRMGADIIIGVDVQEDSLEGGKLNGISGILSRLVSNACKNKYKDNVLKTDVYIKVNVKGYSSASFNSPSVDTLIHRGEMAAQSNFEKLKEIPKRLNFTGKRMSRSFPALFTVPVTKIVFEGVEKKDRNWVIRKCKLSEQTPVSYEQIEQALVILRTELNYSDAQYRLSKDKSGYKLIFHLAEKKATTLHLGLRFDSEDQTAIQMKGCFYFPTHVPSALSLTGRLGKRYMFSTQYSFQPLLMRNINLKYTYHYDDIDFYSQGNKMYNASYNLHTFEVSYSSTWFSNIRYQTGIAYDLYQNVDLMYKRDIPYLTNLAYNMGKYFIRLQYNTLNHILFPTKGFQLKLSGTACTDNFIQYRGHSPFYALSGSISGACLLNDKIVFLPSFCMRLLKGNDIPLVYKNALGGEISSRYLFQQIPFMGVGYIELTNNILLVGEMKLRYHIKGKHYISCVGNIASDTDKLNQICRKKILYGAGLNYTFSSLFGPLGVSVGYSNLTDDFYCFANVGYYF